MWRIARSGATAHLPALVAPFLVVALAAVLVSGTAVLAESGLRDGEAGLLVALAASFAGTATALVVLVVAGTVSLALRQRQREHALLRAVGATRAQVRLLVGREVGMLTLVAAPVGAVAGLLLVPQLVPALVDAGVVRPGFRLTTSPVPLVAATFLLLPVTRLAARLGTRRTLRSTPTAAVAESLVEPAGPGRARRTGAVVLSGLGLAAALSPLAVPGTMGVASAAMSTFLLVGAAAVAGPLLVESVLARVPLRGRRPSTRLALANTRGSSRHLATVVVPLALALGVGTVQATVDDTLLAAGAAQLREGLRSDLVVTGPGLDEQAVRKIASAPGVEAADALAPVAAQVRTDDSGEWLGPLAWEPHQVLALPPGGAPATVDPDVVEGDLARLDRPGTVAISREARLDTGKGLGERLEVRWEGGDAAWATVVAVHERGLGFGDYLVGQRTLAELGVPVRPDRLLLAGDVSPALSSALAATPGLSVTDESTYVEQSLAAAEPSQRLSATLLLLLLVFALVAAGNALVLATAGRRAELALLRRTGATGRQLVAVATVEALLVGGVAWLVGTLTVVPAALGASVALLGAAWPRVDLATYGLLSLAVLLVPLATVVPTVARQVLGRGRPPGQLAGE